MASRPVKLKLLPRSTMKAKVATRLAGQVVAGTGITVVKAGGVFTVSADYGAGIFQLADSDLTALANNTTSGLWAITASGAGAARTLTGTANEITVTNGDGVSGNPTFSLPSAITLTGKTISNGLYVTPTINTPAISGGTAVALTGFAIRSTGAAFDLGLATAEAITAKRIITFVVNDADKTVNLGDNIQTGGPLQTGGAFTTSGASALTLTTTGSTNVTLPLTGTLATLLGIETLQNKTLFTPAIQGGSAAALTTLSIKSSGAAFNLGFATAEAITANRTITLVVNDADRTVNLGGNIQTGGAFQTAGATNLPAIVQGDLWYGSAAGTISALAKSTSTSRFLKNSGTSNNPAWAQPAASDLSDGTTGSGSVVLATTPTLVTPVLGVATATSINKVALTAPATAATLTIANNKTLTVSNTLTFTGTDSTSFAFPSTSDTVATLGAVQTLSQTTAQNLALTGTVSGANTIPYSILAQGNGLSVLGVAGSTTANIAGIVGTANQVLRVNSAGTTLGFGAINLASSAAVTGVLPIANFTTGTPTGAKFVRDDGVLATPAGSGDFVGPGSATDNAAVRFDGTTGKLGQSSGVIIDDSNNITGIASLTATNHVGTTTNNNAAAGSIGEHITASLSNASAMTVTTATAANITSLSLALTAGDWDVSLICECIPAATTVVRYVEVSISQTTGTRDTTVGSISRFAGVGSVGNVFDQTGPGPILVVPSLRISLSGSATVYAVVYADFNTSTFKIYGRLSARRVR